MSDRLLPIIRVMGFVTEGGCTGEILNPALTPRLGHFFLSLSHRQTVLILSATVWIGSHSRRARQGMMRQEITEMRRSERSGTWSSWQLS